METYLLNNTIASLTISFRFFHPRFIYIIFPLYNNDLILTTLQFLGRDTIRRNDVHHSTPPGNGVAVHRTEQALRNGFKQFVRCHVGPVQRFRHAVQVSRAIARHAKVVRLHSRANQVHAGQKGLILVVETANDGFHVVRTEPLFVQQRAHQVTHDRRRHVPLFGQLVQIDAVVQLVLDRLHVRRETRQTDKDLGLHGKQFGKVRGDGGQVLTQATVGGDGDAVFARHGDDCRAVVVHIYSVVVCV